MILLSHTFALGQQVRFRPHHPGNEWSARPQWIHAVTCMVTRDPLRKAVVFYTLSDSADRDARDQRLTPYTREDQLQAWGDEYEHATTSPQGESEYPVRQ